MQRTKARASMGLRLYRKATFGASEPQLYLGPPGRPNSVDRHRPCLALRAHYENGFDIGSGEVCHQLRPVCGRSGGSPSVNSTLAAAHPVRKRSPVSMPAADFGSGPGDCSAE